MACALPLEKRLARSREKDLGWDIKVELEALLLMLIVLLSLIGTATHQPLRILFR